MLNKYIAVCASAFLLLLCTLDAGSAVTPGPKATVESAVDQVLGILRDETLDTQTRRERIRGVIDEHFDFVRMSQSVLSHNWSKATPSEKDGFVAFFSDYLEHTYVQIIETYTNQSIEYGEEKVRGDRAQVNTFVVTKTAKIPVHYRLRYNTRENRWLAYDVLIEGVSLVNNYREVFAAIAASEGMGGVLEDVERRLQQVKAAESRNGSN